MPLIQKDNFTSKDSVRATFKNCRYLKALHIHPLGEIVLVINGELWVKTNGNNEVARAGDVVIIPPYQIHGFFTPENTKVNFWMLLFPDHLMMDILHNVGSYSSTVFRPSDELRAFIKTKLFDTNEKLIELDEKKLIDVKALLYPVFSEFLATNKQNSQYAISENVEGSSYELVTRAVNYLRTNFCNDVRIDDCSAAIGYSVSYIYASLSKVLGMTFLELRDDLRISYAEHLLSCGDMSIYLVAIECGFNSERSFERAFKKVNNVTPRQYRTIMREKRRQKKQPTVTPTAQQPK